MMIPILRLAIVAVSTLLVAAGIGHSADTRPYSLKYALIFEGADPVAGEASCISGLPCEFPSISTRDLKFKFKRSTGELEVDCFDCSFTNGRTKYWCGYCDEIGIFQGRDYGFETLLVIRKRPLVGTLLLRY